LWGEKSKDPRLSLLLSLPLLFCLSFPKGICFTVTFAVAFSAIIPKQNLSLMKNHLEMGSVKGHGFSRANKAHERNRALAPASFGVHRNAFVNNLGISSYLCLLSCRPQRKSAVTPAPKAQTIPAQAIGLGQSAISAGTKG